MVTFIDPKKVKTAPKALGWGYRKAGFKVAGKTKGGLLCLQLLPGAM